jgi:hypothetical protein
VISTAGKRLQCAVSSLLMLVQVMIMAGPPGNLEPPAGFSPVEPPSALRTDDGEPNWPGAQVKEKQIVDGVGDEQAVCPLTCSGPGARPSRCGHHGMCWTRRPCRSRCWAAARMAHARTMSTAAGGTALSRTAPVAIACAQPGRNSSCDATTRTGTSDNGSAGRRVSTSRLSRSPPRRPRPAISACRAAACEPVRSAAPSISASEPWVRTPGRPMTGVAGSEPPRLMAVVKAGRLTPASAGLPGSTVRALAPMYCGVPFWCR